MKLLFTFILIFLLFGVARSNNPARIPSNIGARTVAIMAISNPYIVCRELRFNTDGQEFCKKFQFKDWTLHGLWEKNGIPTGYPKINNNMELLKLLNKEYRIKLAKAWPNYHFNSEIESFWRHEFNKHGRSLGELDWISDPKSYFDEAQTLLKYYNIKELFQSKGAVGSVAYEVKTLKKYIRDKFLVNVQFVCTNNLRGPERFTEVPANAPSEPDDGFIVKCKKGKKKGIEDSKCKKEPGYQYLQEIRMCFTEEGRVLKAVNCRCNVETCTEKVHVTLN